MDLLFSRKRTSSAGDVLVVAPSFGFVSAAQAEARAVKAWPGVGNLAMVSERLPLPFLIGRTVGMSTQMQNLVVSEWLIGESVMHVWVSWMM